MRSKSPLFLDLDDFERCAGITFKEYIRRLENDTFLPSREPERQRIPRAIKAAVWAKTDGFCWYCGCVLNPFSNFHIDHGIPLSHGGTDDVTNLFPSCDHCNLTKGRKKR